MVWLSFILAFSALMIIARKNLWLGMFVGALIIGILNMEFQQILQVLITTITDLPILLLALAVGFIPIIGGSLQVSGLMDDLVNNLQIKRKIFLGLSPALMGLLPIPGGALLSAPMLNKAGKDISKVDYAAINVWFRHILIMIYPLGALLACSKMADINIYQIILRVLPAFAVLFFLGYFFLLRKVDGDMPRTKKLDLKKLLIPLMIIFSAPIVHIILTHFQLMDEISLLIAVSCTLLITKFIGDLKLENYRYIFQKMKPWNFFLIIIAVFFFLHIFETSNVSTAIAKIVFSKNFLIIFIAVILGILTGRIQLPVSILIPIFIAKFGAAELTALTFSVMYVSVFIGYMISPVHPCVSVSIEYFQTDYKKFVGKFVLPSLIGLLFVYFISILLI